MSKLELRKQPRNSIAVDNIEILKTSPFPKADRSQYAKEAKQLRNQNPEYHYWVFLNSKPEHSENK